MALFEFVLPPSQIFDGRLREQLFLFEGGHSTIIRFQEMLPLSVKSSRDREWKK